MGDAQQSRRIARRIDARSKVTGDAQYTADYQQPDLLYGAVLRSQHHHARILSIDTSSASKLPGVLTVLTAQDIPGELTFGQIIFDRPAMASDVVRHIGEPLALVIGDSRSAVRLALDTIKVDYEALPAMLDPVSALEQDAPAIHQDGNLLVDYCLEQGNLEEGFLDADLIVEGEFSVPRVAPAYLEPEAAMAIWQEDNTVRVIFGTQKPFTDRASIGRVLGVPEERVIVDVPTIGGSFGGKIDSGLAILAALGAWKTKGAVQLINSRKESMLAHPKRHPAILKYKMGSNSDGRLVALRADIILETGAYANMGPAVGGTLTELASGPYRIPNFRIETKVVYTNTPICGAMRAFGGPQVAFAYESMMDMIATHLGMDPIQLRRMNAWHKGDCTAAGVMLHEEPSIALCLDEVEIAKERLSSVTPTKGKLSGIGVALNLLSMGLGYHVPDDTTSRVTFLPDGGVRVVIGTPELGQGLTTALAELVSDTIQLGRAKIEVASVNTSSIPKGSGTLASRTTLMVGTSLIAAAEEAIGNLIEYAAEQLTVSSECIDYEQGYIVVKNDGRDDRYPIDYFTTRAAEQDIMIAGEASASFPYPKDTPTNLPEGMPHVMFAYGANIARVEVDPDTGTVDVKDMIAIHDVGKCINRGCVEGQIEGGVVMGLGYTTLENLKLREDGGWTDNFTEYLLPTAMDVPEISSVIIESTKDQPMAGLKGIGEMTVVSVAPAITNAIADATGYRCFSIPVNPEKLCACCKK